MSQVGHGRRRSLDDRTVVAEGGFSILILIIIVAVSFSTGAAALLAASQQHLERHKVRRTAKGDFGNLVVELGMIMSMYRGCNVNLRGHRVIPGAAASPDNLTTIRYPTGPTTAGAVLATEGHAFRRIQVQQLAIRYERKPPGAPNVHLASLHVEALGNPNMGAAYSFAADIPMYVTLGPGNVIVNCISTANEMVLAMGGINPAGVISPTGERTIEDGICNWDGSGKVYDATRNLCVTP